MPAPPIRLQGVYLALSPRVAFLSMVHDITNNIHGRLGRLYNKSNKEIIKNSNWSSVVSQHSISLRVRDLRPAKAAAAKPLRSEGRKKKKRKKPPTCFVASLTTRKTNEFEGRHNYEPLNPQKLVYMPIKPDVPVLKPYLRSDPAPSGQVSHYSCPTYVGSNNYFSHPEPSSTISGRRC